MFLLAWWKRLLRGGRRFLSRANSTAIAPESDVAIHIKGDGTTIEFQAEGLTTSAKTTRVGERLYQLDSIPLLTDLASFKDVIEADTLADGTLRFCRVAKSSGWRTFNYLLPHRNRNSAKVLDVLDRVERLGGYWERWFGGCLTICLPPEIDWDPTDAVVGR